VAMIEIDLIPVWHAKERELGKRLNVKDVAEGAGVDWKTVANLRDGKTTRFDSGPIARLCQYFGVPEGGTIPFLIVRYNNGEDGQ